jgi:hypothetical protein
MKLIILLVIFLLGTVSYGQEQKNNPNRRVNDSNESKYTTELLYNKLEAAYKQTQPDSLDKIFINWNRTIKPNPRSFINKDDTIKAIFSVYKAFFEPHDYRINSNCKYVIVQNKIYYSILETEELAIYDWLRPKNDSIINFRPPIDFKKDKVLYLTKEYLKSINKFLGSQSTKFGEGGIMNPSQPKGESEKRYEYLRPFIPIKHGHWGGWYIATDPIIWKIYLNNTLTKAKINFKVGYEGGEAILEKIDKKWTIKERKFTWIE